MDNDFAFPSQELNSDGSHYHSLMGLTKREYFAAVAMQGLVAHTGTMGDAGALSVVAERSVKMADALLAAIASSGMENQK